MSGHSKWANIKRKKEANDKVKGSLFGRFSKAITLAVVEGGGVGDPEHNVKLRLAVENARNGNMPKDNIARAIEKGMGSDSSSLKEIRYEAFGPGGVGLLIVTTTDNPNRMVASVKNTVERNHGKMGSVGSVSYLFEQCGQVIFPKATNAEDAVFEVADKLSVLDVEQDDEDFIVYIPFTEVGKVRDIAAGLSPTSTEVIFKPSAYIAVSGDDESRLLELISAIDDLDDVSNVFTNAQFSQ